MSPHRIILDTDLAMGAGGDIDDGFALALACADPEIQIDMITTVHGNTDLESATILSGVLLKRLKQDIPLYKGSATGFIHTDEKRTPAPHVEAMRHDGSSIPPTPGYAPVAIVEHVMRNPGEITIVAIGPLTNVAIALLLEPKIVSACKELVIMGGKFFSTPPEEMDVPSEFNVQADPEAARAILRSGIKQRWIGLDVTLQVQLSLDQAKELAKSESSFAAFAGEATIKWILQLQKWFPGRKITSCAMHDPLAVAVVSRPEICRYVDIYASVVTGTGEAKGVMICDKLQSDDPPQANCTVAVGVDAEAFRQHFLGLIKTLEG